MLGSAPAPARTEGRTKNKLRGERKRVYVFVIALFLSFPAKTVFLLIEFHAAFPGSLAPWLLGLFT